MQLYICVTYLSVVNYFLSKCKFGVLLMIWHHVIRQGGEETGTIPIPAPPPLYT